MILNQKIYPQRILLLAILFFVLPIVFQNNSDSSNLSALIKVSFCYLLMTFFTSKYLFENKKLILYYVIVFTSLIIIGVCHYMIFIDPLYFLGKGDFSNNSWREFQAVFNALNNLYQEKHNEGIFKCILGSNFGTTHAEIWNIISFPYYFFGIKWLNFLPFNIYCSLLLSMNLVYLCHYWNFKNETINQVKWTTALFPLFLLGDTVWRDVFGMALISCGLVLYELSEDKKINKIIYFLFLIIFCYIQRIVYPVVVFLAISIQYTLNYKYKGKNLFLSISFITLALLFVNIISGFEGKSNYIDLYLQYKFLIYLPIKIFIGLIGPFPWTEFLKYNISSHYAYQISDYILGIFQLGYLIAIVYKFNELNFNKIKFITAFGFCVMMSGFASKALHIGYIAEGLIFTLPWFFFNIGTEFKKYFTISFVFLLLLNFFIIYIGHFSVSSLWR